MKSIRDSQLLDKLEEILSGIDQLLENEQGRIYLEQIFVYLYFGTVLNPEIVIERAKHMSQLAEEFANSAGMQLIRRGMKEGIKEGIEKGIEKNLRNNISKMLLKDFKASQVANILEVPLKLVKEVEKQLQEEGKL